MNDNEEKKPAIPPQEVVLAALVSTPRVKVDLIKYEFGSDRHFILRRTKFAAVDNVRGMEIKLEEDAAMVLVETLRTALAAPRQSVPDHAEPPSPALAA